MDDKPTLPVETVDRLLRAMLIFSRTLERTVLTRAVEAALHETLSPSKVQVLRLLGHRGGQGPSQIARFLGVSKPAASQLLDSMVRSKLVVRRTSRRDRREAVLNLDSKGKEWFRAVQHRQRHCIRSAFKQSHEPSPDPWIEILEEMSKALAKADRAFEQFCVQCGAHADGSCVLAGGDANCLFLQHQSKSPQAAKRRKSPRLPKST